MLQFFNIKSIFDISAPQYSCSINRQKWTGVSITFCQLDLWHCLSSEAMVYRWIIIGVSLNTTWVKIVLDLVIIYLKFLQWNIIEHTSIMQSIWWCFGLIHDSVFLLKLLFFLSECQYAVPFLSRSGNITHVHALVYDYFQ